MSISVGDKVTVEELIAEKAISPTVGDQIREMMAAKAAKKAAQTNTEK